ncbi:MAG: ornithine cyclodeaminase family protein [Leptospiraceae bacterium]|nr:ornithine cyclodeaminase family protein [Leptospiraceae bacterium]
MQTIILTQSQIQSLVTMDRVIPVVEEAFLTYGNGDYQMPAKVYLSLPDYNGDFRAMPSYAKQISGIKWVNSHPDNPKKHNIPSVMGVYILSDPATAKTLAIMDATYLTALRTGAAAAVASKYLAPHSPQSLGLVGCGVQARMFIISHQVLFGNSLPLYMADKNPNACEQLVREFGGTVVSTEKAASCDIVCTSTPSHQPVIQKEWCKSGSHINAMGADAPGKQELDSELLATSKVVIDDFSQASHSGEINVPLAKGILKKESIYANLGEIVSGKKAGRKGNEITIFDSTGLAIQDVFVANLIYTLAQEKKIGLSIDLRS